MVFDILLVGLLQLALILIFWGLRHFQEAHVLQKLFFNRLCFVAFNAATWAVAWYYNQEQQVFCQPVAWAGVALSLVLGSFLLFPFAAKKRLRVWMLPIWGVNWFVALYLLVFASDEYLIFLGIHLPFFIGFHFLLRYYKRRHPSPIYGALYFYPALMGLPFFLLYQTFLMQQSLGWREGWVAIGGPVLVFGLFFTLAVRMETLLDKIDLVHFPHRVEVAQGKETIEVASLSTPIDSAKAVKAQFSDLVNNPLDAYLSELLLGAHWKYHTQLCLYDGWRPPYHDPTLVMSTWLFHFTDGFEYWYTLPQSAALYQILFPEQPVQFQCRCGKHQLI
ncbi:MAG: hypothetical protein ACFB10_21055 [Salibacteraceae bacterium]